MHLYGKVIVIKRNGTDGAHFPLTAKCCVFGKGLDSDIRIQLPTVDTSQCQILIDDKEHVFIQSTTTTSSTLINDKVLSGALTALSHGDIITIVDRKFRFEFPDDSRFYPHKSPKSKSPRTPKRASMTKLSASEEKDSKFSRHSTPVAPLSPRTDNVPANVKSPLSASKIPDQPAANEDQLTPLKTGRKSPGSAKTASSPGLLFSLPPSAFYRTSFTPGSSNSSDPHEEREKAGLDVLSNIPSVGQKIPGSPYSKTPGNLRKSISDLRRRSVPVLETEEGSIQVLKKNQQPDFATPSVQVGNKRKSTGFDLLSAKRKRVSFGPNLSPEHFDKTLPPKTPIKKGATPNRITKQERKSLLKAKSPGRKSISPRTKTPAKAASTPLSSQVFEIAAPFSPALGSADSAKQQSPKSGLHESESQRSSPRGASENEAISLSISSPRKESLPASKRISQASFKLNENNTSVEAILEYMLLNNAATSSASAVAVLSPNTKLSVLETDGSPLSTGNSSFASPQKSVGRPRSQSSTSLQSSATSKRSDSSFRKSVTPRRSLSASSIEKKRSVGRPRSPSSTSLQSSATSRRSDSSFRKSVTPRKSLSPHEKSASARASLSPKNTPLNASDTEANRKYGETPVSTNISLIEATNSSTKARKLSTSPPLSQDLFSQVSPKAVFKGTQLHNIIGIASPIGIKRIFRTPKHKQTANISPSAIKRLMKTPNVKHIQVSPISPIGLRNLVKTPRNRKSIQVVDTPSGLKQLFKTPHVKVSESPRQEISNNSFSRVSTSSSTLHSSAQVATALSFNSGATPGSPLSRRYSQTPKKFLGKSSSPEKKLSLGQPPLENNQHLGKPSSVKRLSVKRPVGRPPSEKSPVGRSPSVESQTEQLAPGKSPVGRPVTEESPIDRPASEKSPVRRSPSEKSPVDRPLSEKRPVGRSPSEKSPAGRPATEKSPVGQPASKKRPVGRSQPEKSPVGRPASGKSPVGRPASGKSPVGRPPSEKRPVGRPPSEKRPLGSPATEEGPIGRPATENSLIGLSPSVKSPVARPPSEKRPVGQPPSEKRPVGRPPSEKRPVGRPPSEKRPVGRPPSEKKILGMKNSPTEKIISPPQDFKKVVALRAIHGHGLTPKRATFKVLTPTSIRSKASSVFRKTPGKKTWSDVVKSGAQKPAPAKKIELTTIKAVAKRISPKLIKKVHKTPKTPRALARALAPTTGHADSPATIIVGKKFKGTRTPKLLPRKGRKESLSKASRKSVGNTSFTGLAEMFTEPVVNESYLYADIPDTPDGPNEMFVSPLSNRKSSLSSRKSTNLTGVRELFIKKHIQDTNFTGVKELFITSKTVSVSPSGLKRLVKTPKKRSSAVSPTGVKRLLATPKLKAVPVSPVGLDILFKTPTLSGGEVQSNEDSALKPSARSEKTEPPVVSTKSGQRGRKRKSEEPVATPTSKKFKPTQLTVDLSPRSSPKQQEKLKNKVLSARKVSPSKSPSPSRKRQSETVKTQAGSPATVESAAEPQILQPVYQIISPKLTVRGRKGKVAGKNTSTLVDGINVQSPPTVSVHGRKSQPQMMESTVNIERMKIAVPKKAVLSPKVGPRGRAAVKIITPIQKSPKVGPRGRRGQAAVRIATPVQKSPKVGPRGRRGQAAVKIATPVQLSPKVGPRGKRGQATVKIATPVQLSPKVGPRGRRAQAPVKIITPVLLSPKVGPRGRRGQAAVKIATPVQSPPKAGVRGKRGQAKELAVVEEHISSHPKGGRRGAVTKEPAADIETIKTAVAEKQILSPPKGGTRGRKGKAQTQETVSLAVVEVHIQSPPKTGTSGRRAQDSVVKIKTVNFSDADKQILSPAKPGARNGRGKAQSKESTGAGKGISLAVGEEGVTSTKGSGRGRTHTKETPQGQENVTLAVVETADVLSKARRGRGLAKEPVSSLNVDGVTAASKVRPSKTTVIKSTPVKDASVAVIQRKVSPKEIAAKAGRGTSKITESAAVEHALDVMATIPVKNAARGRVYKVRIDTFLPSNDKESQPSTENNASMAKRGGKRGKAESLVVPEVAKATATNSPKHKAGRRRNESSPVTKPTVPEKSGRRGGKPTSPKQPLAAVSSASSNDVSQEAKPVGGVKRKAGKSTTEPSKKVKLDSPVPVSPVKPRGTRRGQDADTKSANINIVSSPKGRGRPKTAVQVKEVASVLTSVAPVVPKPSPKGRKGQLKKAAAETVKIVASPSAGKRGRPKKNDTLQDGAASLKKSPAKSRQSKVKKAPVVEIVVSPAAKKRGVLNTTLAVAGKRKGKSAGAISNAAKVSPKSTVATRRRRL
ncbi:hypothetical protein BsWGS_04747 [Bradybaena similaris]